MCGQALVRHGGLRAMTNSAPGGGASWLSLLSEARQPQGQHLKWHRSLPAPSNAIRGVGSDKLADSYRASVLKLSVRKASVLMPFDRSKEGWRGMPAQTKGKLGGKEPLYSVPVKVMNVREVSAYLRVHPSTIYRMLKQRQIPAFQVGSDWRFNIETIDRWR